MQAVSLVPAPTREDIAVDLTNTSSESSSGRTPQSIICPKVLMIIAQDLASRGREADPDYGKKKGEKTQTLVDSVNKVIDANRDKNLRKVGISAMNSLVPKVRSAAAAVALAVEERDGLNTLERESLAEGMGVNKMSFSKLTAADKATFVDGIIPLLEIIAAYITEDAAPDLLSKVESKKRRLVEVQQRKDDDQRAVKGKRDEPAPRVRGPPMEDGPKVAKEEAGELSAQDKKEMAALMSMFGSSTSASSQVFVRCISLFPGFV